jgi:hypothetical protein
LFFRSLCSIRSGVRAANQQQAVAVQQQQQQQTIAPVAPELVPPLESLEIVTDESVASAWQPDPNEPRYCICNDVSYGDMVGCDNEDVSEFTLFVVRLDDLLDKSQLYVRRWVAIDVVNWAVGL